MPQWAFIKPNFCYKIRNYEKRKQEEEIIPLEVRRSNNRTICSTFGVRKIYFIATKKITIIEVFGGLLPETQGENFEKTSTTNLILVHQKKATKKAAYLLYKSHIYNLFKKGFANFFISNYLLINLF